MITLFSAGYVSELLYMSRPDRNYTFCSTVLHAMALNAGCLTTALLRCVLCCAWPQPEVQYYFHRPLHELLRPFFEAGFALTGMLEPPARAPADYSPERANMKAGMWYEFREFPFAAVFQFCRL